MNIQCRLWLLTSVGVLVYFLPVGNFRNRKLSLKHKCEICGFDRYLEACHIIPKRLGGHDHPLNRFFLCPNHHKLFDYGLLNNEEVGKIQHYLLAVAETNKHDMKVLEYIYFLLGYRDVAPKWMAHTRNILKQKLSNGFF